MVGKAKWTRFRSKGGFYYSSSGGPSYSANVSLGMGYGYGMVSVNIGVASSKSGSGHFLLAPDTKNYFRPWAKKRIKYRVYGRLAHLQAPRQQRGLLIRGVGEGQDFGSPGEIILIEERGDGLRRLPRPHPKPLGRVGGRDGQCRQNQKDR